MDADRSKWVSGGVFPVIGKITGDFEITGKPAPQNRAIPHLIRDLRHVRRDQGPNPRKNRHRANTVAYENDAIVLP